VGLVYLVLAGFLAGGVYSFHRQGKPVAVQVVLGVAAVALAWLGVTTGVQLS
jgi:hypothetical protein